MAEHITNRKMIHRLRSSRLAAFITCRGCSESITIHSKMMVLMAKELQVNKITVGVVN
jgi:predicted metal-binding protein